MADLNSEKYGVDRVGPWVVEKHKRLTKYVDISRAVRRQFIEGRSGEATFIDLYCGPGRSQIRGSDKFIDGGCVAAWKKSSEGSGPFTKVFISDYNPLLAEAAKIRLVALDAKVESFSGSAEEVVDELVSTLDSYGLHFAYLDPYSLNALPFSVIKSLSRLKRIDLLIHISVYDLQRNANKYSAEDMKQFDRFAPGWREKVPQTPNQQTFRAKLFEHWRNLIRDLGMNLAEGVELVRTSEGQRLYWLAFASRNPKAHEFWDKIREVDGQGDLF